MPDPPMLEKKDPPSTQIISSHVGTRLGLCNVSGRLTGLGYSGYTKEHFPGCPPIYNEQGPDKVSPSMATGAV